MEILDLRGVDPAVDKPTRLNVWRPRKRREQAEGEVFHEALPATAAMGFTMPEVSESSVRITLATLATLASATVLGLTLAQLLGGGAGAQPPTGESQPKTAQTSTPTAEPPATTSEGVGRMETPAPAPNAQPGSGGGGGAPGGSTNPSPTATTAPNTDPMVLVETPLGTQCLRVNLIPLEWLANTKGPC